jgi:hypothetical protein
MTFNSLKIRVNKLSKSKRKGFHVFTIHESDSPEEKEKLRHQIELLKKKGEDPLLITIRTVSRIDNLKND